MVSLTTEQKLEISCIIDQWYIKWKDKIVDNMPHRLGFAKEELKQRVCE